MGRRRGDGGHHEGDRMRAELRALAQENEQFIEVGFYRRTVQSAAVGAVTS